MASGLLHLGMTRNDGRHGPDRDDRIRPVGAAAPFRAGRRVAAGHHGDGAGRYDRRRSPQFSRSGLARAGLGGNGRCAHHCARPAQRRASDDQSGHRRRPGGRYRGDPAARSGLFPMDLGGSGRVSGADRGTDAARLWTGTGPCRWRDAGVAGAGGLADPHPCCRCRPVLAGSARPRPAGHRRHVAGQYRQSDRQSLAGAGRQHPGRRRRRGQCLGHFCQPHFPAGRHRLDHPVLDARQGTGRDAAGTA